MFSSPILEVVIGMIFYYLLLSLICTALNEMIEAWLKNRAYDLEHGIRRLLDDPDPNARGFATHVYRKVARFFQLILFSLKRERMPVPGPKTQGLASKLYDHALIRGLYLHSKDLPSYIPPRSFALALMDLVAPGQSGAAGATRVSPGQPNTIIVNGNAPPPAPVPTPLSNLRHGIADPNVVPSAKVRDALLALIDAAGDDAARVRENIENWFNSTTDRIAGWYKRRTQVIILVLGIGIAVVLNADSVLVMDALWHNSALRSSIASQAEQFAEQAKSKSANQSKQGQQKLQQANRTLANVGLPIGWNAQDAAHTLPGSMFKQPRQATSWSLYQLDLHWLGWLITGLAISLGSPFWFDLLNKIIVVRSTVKPQEKSPIEASKD
ncbi:MAG: hypothetical protein ACR2IV_03580 [Bryobacteraceae bacterium]